MQRTVEARLELDLYGPTALVLGVAVARGVPVVTESLTVLVDGRPVTPLEVVDGLGNRLHRVSASAGPVLIDYRAELIGSASPPPRDALDDVVFLRPSRYCPSDALTALARYEFAGLSGHALVDAVVAWVADRLVYLPGSSRPTDGAVQTIAAGAGVCRDYAHVVIALLRALDTPARMVAVYAPHLEPMDFHAVAEVLIEDRWWVVDATRLAPRSSMVRLATGRDAADVAFLTSHGTDLTLASITVGASTTSIAGDDGDLVELG